MEHEIIVTEDKNMCISITKNVLNMNGNSSHTCSFRLVDFWGDNKIYANDVLELTRLRDLLSEMVVKMNIWNNENTTTKEQKHGT